MINTVKLSMDKECAACGKPVQHDFIALAETAVETAKQMQKNPFLCNPCLQIYELSYQQLEMVKLQPEIDKMKERIKAGFIL